MVTPWYLQVLKPGLRLRSDPGVFRRFGSGSGPCFFLDGRIRIRVNFTCLRSLDISGQYIKCIDFYTEKKIIIMSKLVRIRYRLFFSRVLSRLDQVFLDGRIRVLFSGSDLFSQESGSRSGIIASIWIREKRQLIH